MKLYELSSNYTRLLEMADSMDEETFRDTLAAITETLEDKIENTAKFVRCIEADIKAIKAEEERLAERRKALESKVTNTKEYLQQQMEVAGIEKVKRPTITTYIQLDPPSVEIADETLIPSDYMIPQPDKVNRKLILVDLKQGVEIKGCSLKRGRSVRIR